VDTTDFHPRIISGIPDTFVMTEEELASRRDFRKTRYARREGPEGRVEGGERREKGEGGEGGEETWRRKKGEGGSGEDGKGGEGGRKRRRRRRREEKRRINYFSAKPPRRIFTIDPATARDLDDALHVTPLPSGNFLVGVHIADVSHYIQPGTELDSVAKSRATSVYLVHRVIPMLPRLLCENLCSLNPGVDRLAFSVEWELTPEGEIVNQWLGKSVINSAAKLAYGHAQKVFF
jgi:hypothetical protein